MDVDTKKPGRSAGTRGKAARKAAGVSTAPAHKTGGDRTLIALPKRQLLRRDGPLYRQLVEILRAPIIARRFPVGTAMPREADLAARFGISLITVRSALREMEEEGLIVKRAAKPAVVASTEPKGRRDWQFKTFADVAAFTRGAKLIIKSFHKEHSAAAAAAFRVKESAEILCLRGFLVIKGRAVSQITSFFNPSISRGLRRSDFDDVLIFRSVERRLGVSLSGARVTVRAEVADAALAKELDYEERRPILVVELLFHSDTNEPVELTVGRYRGDLFSLAYNLSNDGGKGR